MPLRRYAHILDGCEVDAAKAVDDLF